MPLTFRLILAALLPLACRAAEPSWQIRPDGVGPLRFGAALDQAAGALQVPLSDSVPRIGCGSWHPPGAPRGLSLMVEDGRIVRVDVDSGGIPTTEGVEVGSSEASAREAFHGQFVEQPHKYRWEEGWRYLIRRGGGADSVHAAVFESDGKTIRSYRVGLEPQVEYVERCG